MYAANPFSSCLEHRHEKNCGPCHCRPADERLCCATSAHHCLTPPCRHCQPSLGVLHPARLASCAWSQRPTARMPSASCPAAKRWMNGRTTANTTLSPSPKRSSARSIKCTARLTAHLHRRGIDSEQINPAATSFYTERALAADAPEGALGVQTSAHHAPCPAVA